MQFHLIQLAALLAASGLVHASPASGSATGSGEVTARGFRFGTFCTGPGAVGCHDFQNTNMPTGCFNNAPEFINNISFYTIDAGFKCTWFNFANCGGDSITTTGSATVNLAQTNFDNNIESYSCTLEVATETSLLRNDQN
ncbi:hypothetical protein C8J57DRAFT_1730088 [Mycena rebaudengoi]|nr:hypothetical protein C8J57DRAFT_1730088 [Mycena rebaudengoi]